MILRERRPDEVHRLPADDAQPGAPTRAADARAAARRLLTHAQRVVDRTLSKNSAAALASYEQPGGQ